MGITRLRTVLSLQFCALAFWHIHLAVRAQEDGPLQYYNDENVIDLLEALNITRSIKGVTKAKGREPGIPAWKFRQRVPHLSLPRDFSIYFLSTMQGSIGFHFVAQQAKNSDGTLISFISPAALKKDGRPLLQLVSSTRSNQLRLDYRSVHSMEPASILFPGGTPFSNEHWARVAFNLEAHKISLFIDCEEPIVFEKTGGEDVLSLTLPIDLEITFASVPGDKASKFLGYWQTAEVSTSGYNRRPWHCENMSDSMAQSLSQAELEDHYGKDPSVHLEPQSDSAHDHPQRSHLGPPGSPRGSKQLSPEERLRRLEELVDGLTTMLDMVKAQNTDLESRVKFLETCECRRLTCTWEEQEVEEGARWETDQGSTCKCVTGKVQCAVSNDPCLSNPCLNGGLCQVLNSEYGQHLLGFKCSCPPSAVGRFCEKPVTQACTLPKMKGHCRSKQEPGRRWFYSSVTATCEEFLNSGCGGNDNNFESLHDCQQQCMLGACCYRQPKNPGIPLGFDQAGYERRGYNLSSQDQHVQRRKDESQEWASSALFSQSGKVRSRLRDGRTFDKYGFDRNAYDGEGFHRDTGFNLTGYNRKGGHDGRSEFGQNGYDRKGFNRAGFDCSGLDVHGFNYLGLNAAFTYNCEQLSLAQCQRHSLEPLHREVVSFSVGRSCADVQCRESCGCSFHGRSYSFGDTFEHACEACVCSYTGSVECTCRHLTQRKEVRDMTPEEREVYQRAIRKLYFTPGIWESFARMHADYLPLANGRFLFLPWHRYFLKEVERELQRASSCHISIPYFEWVVDAGSLETSTIWQANFFGGNGDPVTECVFHHPFQGEASWSPCLRRKFNSSVSLPDAVNLQLLLLENDFAQFSAKIWAASALFHLWVGGHMASPLSPYDPVFLSHYAFMDKLWAQWQERGQEISSPFPAELMFVKMKPFDVSLSDVVELQSQLCIVYVPITLGAPCNITSPHRPLDPNKHQYKKYQVDVHDYEKYNYSRGNLGPKVDSDLRGKYNKKFHNKHGYDRNGYDQMGWNMYGFSIDGFDRDHMDVDGYDIFGYNRYGFNRSNITSFGMKSDGTFESSVRGEAMDELFEIGYNKYGFDAFGLDRNGFDMFGFRTNGYDKDNCNFYFRGPHYMRFYFFAQLQISMAGLGTLSRIKRICPHLSPLPESWVFQNWMAVSIEGGMAEIRRVEQQRALQHPFDRDYIPNISSVKESGLWLPITPDLRFCFELHWFSGCPVGPAPVTCPDLCKNAHCVGYPEAECRVHNCGSCFTECSRGGCVFEGKKYSNGEVFSPDPCLSCVCENGQSKCLRGRCHPLTCLNQYIPEGECCPICQPGCEYEEEVYENGAVFVSRSNPCQKCTCTNSLVKCTPIQCQPTTCSRPFQLPGQCCPTCSACDVDGRPHNGSFNTLDGCQICTCKGGQPSCVDVHTCPHSCSHGVKLPHGSCCPDCSRCSVDGQVILDGVSYADSQDPCKRCVCMTGNLVCTAVSCPPLDCIAVETSEGKCCPRCRGCVHNGIQREHGLQWSIPDNPCTICTCVGGQVECRTQKCAPPCKNPSSPPPGSCCPVCDGCGVNGQDYLSGEQVPGTDRCQDCVCVNGDLQCSPTPCPHALCRDPVTRPGECCPRCEQCEYESQVYVDGQVFVSRLNPCMRCHCSGGKVSCEQLDHTCPPLHCTHPAKKEGQCCPTCEMCEYERKVYADGKRFNPPGNGPCVHCTCKNGNVRCHEEKCPPTKCSNPIRDPQLCCPICKVCVLDGVEFLDGAEWAAEGQPCSRCRCVAGEPVCHVTQCPRVSCLHPSKMEGQCCASCDLCTYNQRVYSNGQDFTDPDDPCQQCRCQDGTVQCTATQCNQLTCSNPRTPPGQCCPQCPDCDFENRVFVDGEEFPSPVNPCQECVCSGGQVDCQDQECPRPPCTYPLPGSCCQNNCNGCNYAGKEYPNGMEFPHPTDRCRTCHCINGNVQCLMKRCPAQQCSNPYMVSGECCPQCPAPPADCSHLGQSYKHTERFYDPADKCRICTCTNGSVGCQRRPCSHAHCTHPILQDCCRTCDGCLYDGKEHANGETFADPSDPCGTCVCRQGSVTCERKRCPTVACPFPVNTQCCQICDGCSYVGEEYLNGQEFTDPRNKCNRCTCAGGHVTCSPKPCYAASCSHPISLPGSCCPVCEGCFYDGVSITTGQSFPDPKDSECSECTCRAGTVHCVRKICSPTECSHPAIGPCNCPVCEGCVFEGRTYIDGDIVTGPKGKCEECRCTGGEVTCSSKRCAKVTCTHPAKDGCSCPVCDSCHFNGRDCNNGEHFLDPKNKCQRCTCLNGGVTCIPVACSPTSCRNPITPPGECCPVCRGRCKHKGQVYESGVSFDSPSDRCRACTCLNEVVTCHRKPCQQKCSHPVPSSGCCPVCDACLYEGIQYTSGQTFTASSNPCLRCSCIRGTVACTPQVCPSTPCKSPVTPPDQCCPRCPAVCLHQGQEYADGLHWVPSSDNCQECTCAKGEVRCTEVVCKPPCSHPSPALLGQCCPQCEDCFLDGVLYSDGDDFALNGCRQCSCNGGNILCSAIECPKLTCMHQVRDPGTCCPRCRGCKYDGREHEEGSTWLASSTPCMSCMCVDGVTTCSEVHCVSPCLNHIEVPGECCAVCADCIYNGKVYGPGDSFHPSNDPCQICTCEVMPDGEQHLRCYRKQCPSLVDCPKNHILFSGPDSCCPVCAQPLSNCTETLIGNEVHATDDPCFTCMCKDLTWTCVHQGCLPLSCPLSEQFTPEDSCCPACNECVIEGGNERLTNGESWTDPLDECIACTCNLGYIECNIQECEPLVCLDGEVKVKSPGQCCYECQDPSVSCVYQGTLYQSNEHWEVDECTSCMCVSGDVHCQTERCPQVTCSSDETPALIPGMCCPHCIPRPATCIAFGDPHYRTFDGKMINFQGACTYVLAEDCEGGDFSIHVTNDDRGRKGVSWTKEVMIFIGDVVVQLLQNWMVMVDSQAVTLPYLKEPYIYVERKTNTILLNTNIGVKVMWNGKSHLEVSVPGTYKNHICGLCGNFNNYPQDDMRLRTGQTVKSEAAFGNSWKVNRENDTASKCRDGEDIDPCKEAGYFARKTGNIRCAILKSEVFEPCHKVVPPEMFYASCVYDLCACGANSDDCLCDALEAYASECREAGVVLKWRTHALCAVGCPLDRGFVFDECGPPCPKTCFNKDVPLGVIESHCFKPCIPGCQCPAGLVEHESHCISPEACPKIIYGNS